METVTLRTGKEVPGVLISTTMLALDRLLATNPIAVYELVMACRDPEHVTFGNSGEAAESLALAEAVLSDGRLQISSTVRDIVLAATEDSAGFDIALRSPVTS